MMVRNLCVRLVILLVVLASVSAKHYKGGSISWRRDEQDPKKIHVNVNVGVDIPVFSAFAARVDGEGYVKSASGYNKYISIEVTEGGSTKKLQVELKADKGTYHEKFFSGYADAEFTMDAPGPFSVSFVSPCCSSSVLSNLDPTSADDNGNTYRVTATGDSSLASSSHLRSPRVSIVPVWTFHEGANSQRVPIVGYAENPDKFTVSFKDVTRTSKEDKERDLLIPDGLTLENGVINWNAASIPNDRQVGLGLKIEEEVAPGVITSTEAELYLVVAPQNTATLSFDFPAKSYHEDSSTLYAYPDQLLTFDAVVEGGNDQQASVFSSSIQIGGDWTDCHEVMGASVDPGSFTDVQSFYAVGNSCTRTFEWTPSTSVESFGLQIEGRFSDGTVTDSRFINIVLLERGTNMLSQDYNPSISLGLAGAGRFFICDHSDCSFRTQNLKSIIHIDQIDKLVGFCPQHNYIFGVSAGSGSPTVFVSSDNGDTWADGHDIFSISANLYWFKVGIRTNGCNSAAASASHFQAYYVHDPHGNGKYTVDCAGNGQDLTCDGVKVVDFDSEGNATGFSRKSFFRSDFGTSV